MVTLSAFTRRVSNGGREGGREVDVELAAGEVRWLGAQEHVGHNIGDTDTHTIFIELKGEPSTTDSPLGPVDPSL